MFVYVDSTKEAFLEMLQKNGMQASCHEQAQNMHQLRNETYDDFEGIIDEVYSTPYPSSCKELFDFDF